MGQRGPMPKDAAARRRRNTASPGQTVLPAEGRSGSVPALPGASGYSATVRRWWRDAWRSPMATQWDPATDVPALARLAALRDRALAGTSNATELAEARQLEDRYGLNPQARARLGWTVEEQPVAGGDELGGRIVELADRLGEDSA